MKLNEKEMWELMKLTEFQFSEEKRTNVRLFMEICVEAVKRCPKLAEIPLEEKRELIKILREKEIL